MPRAHEEQAGTLPRKHVPTQLPTHTCLYQSWSAAKLYGHNYSSFYPGHNVCPQKLIYIIPDSSKTQPRHHTLFWSSPYKNVINLTLERYWEKQESWLSGFKVVFLRLYTCSLGVKKKGKKIRGKKSQWKVGSELHLWSRQSYSSKMAEVRSHMNCWSFP